MNFEELTHKINKALNENDINSVHSLISKGEKQPNIGNEHKAILYCYQGRAFMKQSQWTSAMSAFLQSEEIQPNGPARQYRLMLLDIMNFYNKDMFNQ